MTTVKRLSRIERAKLVLFNRVTLWKNGGSDAEQVMSRCRNKTSFEDKLVKAEKELENLKAKVF